MFDAEKVKGGIIRWIREFFDKNGNTHCAVIGISGGKDSSVCAALCAEALGADRVYGVLLPRGEQWDISVSQELVNYLGIKHSCINIDKTIETLCESISHGGLNINEQAAINTPARIRMTILYAAAAIVNGFVVNTCNLSEDWVGYSTKFGDSAGDFSPLSRLTVSEVKAVGRALGLPVKFIEKIPEDGLSGKTDEEKLGFSYELLDRYIREGLCPDPVIREKIDRMHTANLHKISLMPCFEIPPIP